MLASRRPARERETAQMRAARLRMRSSGTAPPLLSRPLPVELGQAPDIALAIAGEVDNRLGRHPLLREGHALGMAAALLRHALHVREIGLRDIASERLTEPVI